MKPRKTLAEMSGREPMQISGKPADICPYCGCAMFINGVSRTEREIVRYVECRNKNCARRFVSYQAPAKLLREINVNDNSADGKPTLTISRAIG